MSNSLGDVCREEIMANWRILPDTLGWWRVVLHMGGFICQMNSCRSLDGC